MYINSASLIGKIELYWRQLIKLKKIDLLIMINPHRWLKHLPNQSRTSRIRKSMSDLSRVMEKYANPGKWRENHGGWVGNKR